MKALRILQLCNKPPFPAVDGGCLAMLRMAEGLIDARCELTILSIATSKHPWMPLKANPEFLHRTSADSVFVDTAVKSIPALLSYFKSESYNVQRFYSLEFEKKLIALLEKKEFDIIQLESLFMSPYIEAIRKASKAKIVLRAHNTESAIWKKYSDEEKGSIKKIWFRDLAAKLEKQERSTLNKIDGLVSITPQDEQRLLALGAQCATHLSTFAMTEKSNSIPRLVNDKTVFHIGAMDWKPNADGIEWLLKKVWPIVLRQIPDAQLHLAGKGMKVSEYAPVPNVTLHGEVENAKEFMQPYRVMAVPLFSGGGVKIKVIEGLFNGKPIVTTSIAAEGLAVTNGYDIAIADTPEVFASEICQLLLDDTKAEKLQANSLKTAKENHELSRVTAKLCDFYRTIVSP